jgi:hypothetical protein
MLQACANPDCSVHFAIDSTACPICGTLAKPTEQRTASALTMPAASDGKMTEEEGRGKNLLVTLLLVMIIFDVTASLFAVAISGASVLPRIVRLGLNLLLCSEMYRGSIAARRVTVVLYLIGAAWLVVTILAARESIVTIVGGAGLIFLVAFTVILVNSPSINAFMAYQRSKELESTRKLESPATTTGANDRSPGPD